MNGRYEAKFGHVFIICASGKSAQDMLTTLKNRQANCLPAFRVMSHGKCCSLIGAWMVFVMTMNSYTGKAALLAPGELWQAVCTTVMVMMQV